jgi:hypothetical protein
VLSSLQLQVAQIVGGLPEADGFALAGGAALVLSQIVDRETRDLDFFGASADEVDRLLPSVRAALSEAGLTVRVHRQNHGFARLTITSDDETTELDLAADARIRPTEVGPVGPILSIEELGADKLLALFGRAQARDFFDVAALAAHFGFDQLCALASEKDPGFSRPVLNEMLGSFRRFTAADLNLTKAEHEALALTIQGWRDGLAPDA